MSAIALNHKATQKIENVSDRNRTSTHLKAIQFKKIEFPETLKPASRDALSFRPSLLITKRLIDIVGSVVGLLILSPVMLIVALAVKGTSPGPIFYRQTRVGQNGQLFEMIKFRSMRVDAEAQTGAIWADESKGKVDPRVTPIGNFLRKSHLDELPQLLLVLQGVMSVVGPRPERPEFVNELQHEYTFYLERINQLKPGITGIAQMNREVDESLKDTDQKLIADHSYGVMMSSLSLWQYIVLEIKIVFMTVWNIIR